MSLRNWYNRRAAHDSGADTDLAPDEILREEDDRELAESLEIQSDARRGAVLGRSGRVRKLVAPED